MKQEIDWALIQEKYNSGMSYRDIIKEFGINSSQIAKAVKSNLLKTRTFREARILASKTKPRKHTEETKKKLSELKIKYYQENPDKIPYRVYHSSKRSIPELIFEKALKDSNIQFKSELPMGIYQFDFAIENLKIAIEIDGDTHKKEKIIKKDARRDEWSTNIGWRVIRFSASDIVKDVNSCLNILLQSMNLPLLPIKQSPKKEYFCSCGKKINKGPKQCLECYTLNTLIERRKFNPTKEELEKLIWELPTIKIANLYNVSDKAIEKRCKKLGISKPPRGYWTKLQNDFSNTVVNK